MKSHTHFPTVQRIYQTIEAAGFQVLLAGGCVRDGLLERLPNDFDLATNAKPDQILSLFSRTVEVGKAFGVIIVVEDGIEVEVASFRSDGLYEDGRRPTVVEFSSPEEDAKRRDFTVNALFYDLSKDQVVDFVGGREDLKNRLLRAVGNPGQRFREDHLRLLRAVRFMGQLDFGLETFTRQAVIENVALVATVSRERIHQEISKLLNSDRREQALQEFAEMGFSAALFPDHPLQLKSWIKNFTSEFESLIPQDEKLLCRWFLLTNALWENELHGFAHRNKVQATELSKRLDSWLSELRFSNHDRQNLLKMLSWRILPSLFQEKSLGELTELYFDLYHRQALKIYAEQAFFPGEKYSLLQKNFEKFHGQKPEALVKATDLPLQGPKLGQALKLCYWAQLEGKISSQQEALDFLKIQGLL